MKKNKEEKCVSGTYCDWSIGSTKYTRYGELRSSRDDLDSKNVVFYDSLREPVLAFRTSLPWEECQELLRKWVSDAALPQKVKAFHFVVAKLPDAS